MPDSYRPTLFDFVAHQALEFYNSGEQAAAKAEDAFELSADSPIFRPAEEFVAWKVADAATAIRPRSRPSGSTSSCSASIRTTTDKSAFLDADLERLSFGNNKAVGEEKAARYKAALKRFVKQWGDHQISAIARFRWASVLQQEGALVEAHDLAQQGARAFPNTPGGKLCYNLVKQIEAKSANIIDRAGLERALARRSASRYRNVTKVYFRLVREDWLSRLKSGQYRGEWLDDAQRKALLAEKPDLAWSADLPATEDYQERVEDLPAPKDLKPGFYYLLASHDPSFSDVEQRGLVHRRLGEQAGPGRAAAATATASFGGFVLDAASGEPIAGAEVQVYAWDWNGHVTTGAKAKTDRNGLFSVAGVAKQQQPALRHPRGPGTGHGQRPLCLCQQLPADSAEAGRSSSPTARSTAPARRSSTRASPSSSIRRATTTRSCPTSR